ncbi:MAG: LysM peptidoglycan-binding domain-containing protein [Gammaproteobacteria bacterium]|nr:LysM peptidoglycan-binding domain-containing protein [Gammaproteobacteria bacterium]
MPRVGYKLCSRLYAAAVLAAAVLVSLCPMAFAGDGLARPPGLEAEVGFWRQVFTDVQSSEALVHDDRHLGVVYEKVNIPDGASASKRRRFANDVRKRYRNILTTLAGGKRSGLTSAEQRVLALWGEDVSNAELRRAAKRIRFQQGLADRFRDGYIRSGRWRDYIVAELRDEGVPIELAALPHVESSFNPKARSHVGASGLWQFTRSTGRRFMQVDHVVDGRRDPFISSRAAAQLLSYNYSILQSWPLAITAYNHGVAGMRRAVRTVGTEDIETIIRNYQGRAFGFASRNFYVAFLAAVEAQENVEQYFGPLEQDSPQHDLVINLPDYMPAAAIVEAFGLPEGTLRRMNPALLDPVWSGTKHVPRAFPLRLPEERLVDSAEHLMAAVPEHQRFAEQTPDLYHRVRRGDSLSAIARRYRTSTNELVALNGLRSRHKIRVGQVLRLPYSGDLPATPAAPKTPIEPGTAVYVVRAGDTVGTIASRAGMTERELLAMNDIRNRNRIYPGQELRLRRAEVQPPSISIDPAVVLAAAESLPAPEPVLAVEAQQSVAAAPEPVTITPPEPEPPEPRPLIVDEPVAVADAADDGTAIELLTDPADYLVDAKSSIEVQAAETLGHYADWLEIRTQRLRDLNGYAFRRPVVIGQRLRLDFSRVEPDEFVARRIAYHRSLQESFFMQYRVADTTVHRMRRGESIWELAQQRYEVPVWLLRQYNPDLDLDRVRPGLAVVFPRVEQVDRAAHNSAALAEAN